eukprot:m.411082 g.411082  ORF g.411082 m.411082 type:complete len:66 (+) comp20159_c1_seq1:806-1003(+)
MQKPLGAAMAASCSAPSARTTTSTLVARSISIPQCPQAMAEDWDEVLLELLNVQLAESIDGDLWD